MHPAVFIINFEHRQLNIDLFFLFITLNMHFPTTHMRIMTWEVPAVIPQGQKDSEKDTYQSSER